MPKLSCDICGGNLEVQPGGSKVVCTCCGISYSIERVREICTNTNTIDIQKDEVTSQSYTMLQNQKQYDITDGVLVKYAGHECHLVLPDGITQIGMPQSYPFESVFSNYATLTSISLPMSVERIETGAFKGCSSLQTIVLPDNIRYIGNSAFEGCQNLTNIKLSSSLTYIGASAFRNCSSLSGIEIPDGVTNVGCAAFAGCKKLQTVQLPSKLTEVAVQTFAECSILTNVIIPEGVKRIAENAFDRCSMLQSIVIPSSVKEIEIGAFSSCQRLNDIKHSNSFPTHISHTEWNPDGPDRISVCCVFDGTPYIDVFNKSYWKSIGLCQYCGGPYKGVIIKKCMRCNRLKNY